MNDGIPKPWASDKALIKQLKAELAQEQEKNLVLSTLLTLVRAQLRDRQWGTDGEGYCWECSQRQERGHLDTCQVFIALGGGP